MGCNDLMKLIQQAQQERREAIAADEGRTGCKEEAGSSSRVVVDGAAALEPDSSVVGAATAEIEDPRKCCWNCKTPAQEDNLCLCSGCKKVFREKVKYVGCIIMWTFVKKHKSK